MNTARDVSGVTSAYPTAARARFSELRTLLLAEAERLDVGPLTETLKWGQPSFLTSASGSGTTVRLHWSEKAPDVVQVLVHCQTSLVESWRQAFGNALEYEGNRAVYVPLNGDFAKDAVAQCFAAALTYHRR